MNGVIGLALVLGYMAAQNAAGPPIVHADHSVTFTYRDPRALKVSLNLEGRDGIEMTKDSAGIWSYTTTPMPPDYYGYTFSADGETRMDVNNPSMKPNLIWQSNMFLVPGNPPEEWEVQNVPHGSIHHHFYKSGIIGDERDYFVYTPPNYRVGVKYPVLYLLHGYSDMASGWTAVGQAHVILDNLIAQGKAKPMLIVMTLGYGVPNFASPRGTGFRNSGTVKENYEKFKQSLFDEVIPAVEKGYSVSSKKQSRAIAGLSMGGAESLFVGLNAPGKFGYIGAFSSGGLSGNDFKTTFPNIKQVLGGSSPAKFWISCGAQDGLITFHRSLVDWLKQNRFKFESHETEGRHTWMVWRRNLIDFGKLLFK